MVAREINVKIRASATHLILDRGRIMQVSATQLTLRERDGSVVVIPLRRRAIVGIDGAPRDDRQPPAAA